MQEKYWYIKNCRLFERLETAQLDWLEARSRIRKFPRNTSIYLPADQSDGVLLLAEGRVKLCSVTPEGKQSILTFIEPGEVFGELAIFDRGQREEFAEAVEASTVVLIPADYLRKVVEENRTWLWESHVSSDCVGSESKGGLSTCCFTQIVNDSSIFYLNWPAISGTPTPTARSHSA